MSSVNHSVLHAVIQENAEPMVLRVLGPNSAHCIELLFRTIRHVYTIIAPESHGGKIHIVVALGNDLVLPKPQASIFSLLDAEISGIEGGRDFVLQILHSGGFALWQGTQIDPARLARIDAVLYEFDCGRERILVKQEHKILQNPYVGSGSAFAPPTFGELQAALERYGATLARFSHCPTLQGIWQSNTERLYLLAKKDLKPEEQMRRSLEHFLRIDLRIIPEVRPEQNVNEKNPVDLKLTWPLTRRRAIIEIKWLGKSVDETGKVTADYRDKRANDGAAQLVSYLNSDHEYASGFITRGYLVVFDARRDGLSGKGRKRGPSPKDANLLGAYRAKEIDFDPRYEDTRKDFNRPIRFFLEPI